MEDGIRDAWIIGLFKPSLEAFSLMALGDLRGKDAMISSNDLSEMYRSFSLPSSSSVHFNGLNI